MAIYLATHSLPLVLSMRPGVQTRLDLRGFILVYSALSLAALAQVPLVVILPVCLILALAIGRPNTFSSGGARNECFDPARAGIVRVARHPLLLALALWVAAHWVPNGYLVHVLLFGVFAVFAAVGDRLVDRRKQREQGAQWNRLYDEVMARADNMRLIFRRAVSARLVAGGALCRTDLGAPLAFRGQPVRVKLWAWLLVRWWSNGPASPCGTF